MTLLGLDIGGANIKAADGTGFAASRPFPLWKHPDQLTQALTQTIAVSPPCEQIIVTMTGELADCYQTKSEGVQAILDATVHAVDGRQVLVYLTDGRLVSPEDAAGEPLLAAASNWHALARFASRYCRGQSGLLVDIGSTTCDIVPTVGGEPAPVGRTDPERLVAGELVYTGVERSPLCAVIGQIPWRDQRCPLAQELFATTADVYLLLGKLPEDAKNTQTADGRPRTLPCAHARLARAICADTTMFSREDAVTAAESARDAQLSQIEQATCRVIGRSPQSPTTVVVSGIGEFLACELLDRLGLDAEVVSLRRELGPDVSRCAPAHALATIARETVPCLCES